MSELDEIRAAWAEATPGPWAASYGLGDGRAIVYVEAPGVPTDTIAKTYTEEDATAIAAAPEHITRLLGMVEEARNTAKTLLFGDLDIAKDRCRAFLDKTGGV